MLRGVAILAGPARSGKTHRLLGAYRQVLTTHPPGAALWLSSTFRAAAEVRWTTVAGGLRGCFSPQCLTFEGFAQRVLDASALEIVPIGLTLTRHILERLVDEALARGELRYFSPIARTSGFLDLVVGFIRELKRLEIWPEQLVAACGARPTAKDRELCRLYRAYQELLTEHHLYDAQGRFWLARTLLRDGQRRPFERLRHVFVDGFTDFTRTEHEILEILAGRVESLVISLPCDGDGERDELFSKTSRTIAELRARHGAIQLEQLPPREDPWPAMAHLERNLFANLQDVKRAGDASGIEILPGVWSTHEIELVAREIKSLLVRGDPVHGQCVAPNDILVVFRSLAETADVVREVFGRFGIPVAIPTPRPLGSTPVARALLAWLALDLDDWPFRQLLRVLGHNYFRPAWSEWDEGRASAAAQRLVYALEVPSGRAELISAIERISTAGPDQGAAPRGRAGALAEQARRALPLLNRLAGELDRLPRDATPAQWAGAITALAEATGMLQAAEAATGSDERSDRENWQCIVDALRAQERLARWLGQPPPRLDRRAFFERLQELLASETLPLADDETGRVRVLPAESARNLSAPYVFVAGMSEQAFPPPHRDDCIHSDAETRELIAAGLPLVPHALRRGYEMLLFYEVVTRATRRLVLSYPALDSAALPMSPSPYLGELEQIFMPLPLARPQEAQLSGVPSSDDVFSRRDFRVRAVARAVAGDGAMLGRLHGQRALAEAANNIVAGLRASTTRRRGKSFGPFEGMLPSDRAHAALRVRYDAEHCWSPSQLERYARCPYQFFLSSVLGLEPLEEPSLESDYQRRGRMLHAVLLAAHRQLNEQAREPASPSELPAEQFRAASLELLSDLVERMRADHGLEDGLLEIDSRYVAAWLDDYHRQHVAYDEHWIEWSAPARPAHFEVAFGPSRHGGDDDEESGGADVLSTREPFILDCGTEAIRLSGRIDRIDVGRINDQRVFNIVDYKSGRPSPTTSARAVAEGYSLQLPLYALAARKLLSEQEAVPFRAAYWHVAAGGYKVKEAVKIHLERAGVLAASPDWESLESRLRDRVRRLVEGIRRGEFPMYSVDDKCTSYCSFSTVCRVNQARRVEKTWSPGEGDAK